MKQDKLREEPEHEDRNSEHDKTSKWRMDEEVRSSRVLVLGKENTFGWIFVLIGRDDERETRTLILRGCGC